ncbi:MAG: hypothetical protein ACLPSL_05770 [Smithella sp.]
MEEFRKKIPDTYKKVLIISVFGAVVGGGIGGYISALKGNQIYSGIGAVIGYIIGTIIGLLARNKIGLQSLVSTESRVNLITGITSIAIAISGIIAFIGTHKWENAGAVLFFGAGGVYLLIKKRR